MKIVCDKCGFSDIPTNYHGIQEYNVEKCEDNDTTMRMIYVQCPICENREFFQHFYIKEEQETVHDTDIVSMSLSHMLAVSFEEADKDDTEKAREIFEQKVAKLQELRKKYIKAVGTV